MRHSTALDAEELVSGTDWATGKGSAVLAALGILALELPEAAARIPVKMLQPVVE